MVTKQLFSADVESNEQRMRLIVADGGADGWIAAVYYPHEDESITLCQLPEIEDAKAKLEGWVRIVHKVNGKIEWHMGPQGREKNAD